MTTALPPDSEFTDPGVTQAQFKTALASPTGMTSYLRGLLGSDGSIPTALTTLGLTSSAAYNPRGTWVSGNSYAINDLVTYAGATYISINSQPDSTIPPSTDLTDWALLQGVTLATLAAASAAGLIGTSTGLTVEQRFNADEAALSGKALDSTVVHLTGAETITGAKTFTAETQVTTAPVNPNDVTRLSDLTSIAAGLVPKTAVAAATTAALPSNTYSNGTLGVGATLTANANGAFPAIDGVSIATGTGLGGSTSRVWVKNEAAPANDGIYVLTTAGSGSAVWVLTRATDFDSAAHIANGFAGVAGGSTNIGNQYGINLASGSITVGTTSLAPIIIPAPSVAAEATARAAADTAIHASLDPIALQFVTSGYSRAPWLMAIVDAAVGVARNIFLGIDTTETLQIGIPTVFRNTITLLKALTLASVTLGTESITYLTGYIASRCGWRVAWVDNSKNILFGMKYSDLSLWSGGKQLAWLQDLATFRYGPSALIRVLANQGVCIGDSLTFGNEDGTGVSYPSVLAASIGWSLANLGIGGQKSTPAAMRLGAVRALLTLTGNALPASGTPVTVTAINGVTIVGMTTPQDPDYRLLSTPADSSTRSIQGTALGVPCTLTRTASGGPPSTSETYTLTPSSGSGMSFPAGTAFIPNELAVSNNQALFVCIGRNNFTQTAQVMSDIAAVVAIAKTLYKKIIIFPILNAANEGVGTSSYNTIVALNELIRTTYPDNCAVDSAGRDLRQWLAVQSTGSAADIIDMANDVPVYSGRAVDIAGTLSGNVSSTTTTTIPTTTALSPGVVITVGAELMYVQSYAAGNATVIRSYASTTPSTYSSGQAFTGVDALHQGSVGYTRWAAFAQTYMTAKAYLTT